MDRGPFGDIWTSSRWPSQYVEESKLVGHLLEYVVTETRDGKIAVLKRGFASKEEAEDHPIRMSDWKRVWVEALQASDADATGPRTG